MSDLSLFTSLLLGGHSHNLVKCVVQHSLVDQPCWPNYKLGYQLPSFPLTCWKSEKERQSAVRKGFVAAVSGLHRPPNLTFLLIWFSWNMKFSYFWQGGVGLSVESRKVWECTGADRTMRRSWEWSGVKWSYHNKLPEGPEYQVVRGGQVWVRRVLVRPHLDVERWRLQ